MRLNAVAHCRTQLCICGLTFEQEEEITKESTRLAFHGKQIIGLFRPYHYHLRANVFTVVAAK